MEIDTLSATAGAHALAFQTGLQECAEDAAELLPLSFSHVKERPLRTLTLFEILQSWASSFTDFPPPPPSPTPERCRPLLVDDDDDGRSSMCNGDQVDRTYSQSLGRSKVGLSTNGCPKVSIDLDVDVPDDDADDLRFLRPPALIPARRISIDDAKLCFTVEAPSRDSILTSSVSISASSSPQRRRQALVPSFAKRANPVSALIRAFENNSIGSK